MSLSAEAAMHKYTIYLQKCKRIFFFIDTCTRMHIKTDRLAGQRMERSRATLKDVAEKSGYALRTVKKVMSGTENVGEKTRTAVLQAAEELNYQRNILASTLSKGKTTRIAIVYAETTKTYFPEVEKGFMQCAEEFRDYGMSI